MYPAIVRDYLPSVQEGTTDSIPQAIAKVVDDALNGMGKIGIEFQGHILDQSQHQPL